MAAVLNSAPRRRRQPPAHIAQQLSRFSTARAERIARAGPEWMSREAAARVLCISDDIIAQARAKHRYDRCAAVIDWKPASERGAKTARGCGLLLRRSDVERIAAIRKRCHVGFKAACRIYATLKKDGPL